MTDDDRSRILDELERFSNRPALRNDEITVADYAARYGFSHQTAAARLMGLVADGVMEMRRGVYDPRVHKTVNAYRFANAIAQNDSEAGE